MTLGHRIASYRKQKNMTQVQLGERLNISAQAVSKWENDLAQPDVATLIELSKIFEVSLEKMLTGEEPVYPPQAPPPAPQPTPQPAPMTRSAPSPYIVPVAPAPTRKKERKTDIPRRILKGILARKKLIISLLAITLALVTVVTTVSMTVLSPGNKISYNRANVGMSVTHVEKMFGEPHYTVSQKEIDGYVYSTDDTDAFTEGFLEGLSGSSAKVLTTTYYYYSGRYGRLLKRLNKVYEKIDKSLSMSKINRLSRKATRLEEKLDTVEQKSVLRITFNAANTAVEVYYYSEGNKLTKKS